MDNSYGKVLHITAVGKESKKPTNIKKRLKNAFLLDTYTWLIHFNYPLTVIGSSADLPAGALQRGETGD